MVVKSVAVFFLVVVVYGVQAQNRAAIKGFGFEGVPGSLSLNGIYANGGQSLVFSKSNAKSSKDIFSASNFVSVAGKGAGVKDLESKQVSYAGYADADKQQHFAVGINKVEATNAKYYEGATFAKANKKTGDKHAYSYGYYHGPGSVHIQAVTATGNYKIEDGGRRLK